MAQIPCSDKRFIHPQSTTIQISDGSGVSSENFSRNEVEDFDFKIWKTKEVIDPIVVS